MDAKLLEDIRAEMIEIGRTIGGLRADLARARGANRARIQDKINALQPIQREIQRAYMAAKRAQP